MTKINVLCLTLTLYLQLVITRVWTLPLAESLQKTKTSPSREKTLLRRSLRRQKRSSFSYPAFLYTRHTGQFVKVASKEIHATDKDDKYAELLLATHSINGTLSIQGKESKKFVCMDDKGRNKGRVILKRKFNKKQCMFYMKMHENGYVTFRLMSNTTWYLGFKKDGSIKHGHRTDYDHKAAWMIIQRLTKQPS